MLFSKKRLLFLFKIKQSLRKKQNNLRIKTDAFAQIRIAFALKQELPQRKTKQPPFKNRTEAELI